MMIQMTTKARAAGALTLLSLAAVMIAAQPADATIALRQRLLRA